MVQKPPNVLHLALSDIDGTVNDDTRAESERMSTIAPAKEALLRLRHQGFSVGLVTGRSLGEARHYADALSLEGPIICEDGAVVTIPVHSARQVPPALEPLKVQYANTTDLVLRLSEVSVKQLAAIVAQTERELGYHLISTCGSSAEDLKAAVSYQTLQAASRGAERLASAFVLCPQEQARQHLCRLAAPAEIRTFGEPLHKLGADADKGTAIRFLIANADLLVGPSAGIDRVQLVVFGNSDNDLPALRVADELGGYGVLVSRPSGGYHIPAAQLPPSTIRTEQPCGEGVLEAVAELLDKMDSSTTPGEEPLLSDPH